MTMGLGGMNIQPTSPTAQVSPAGSGAIINNGQNTDQMRHVQAPSPTGVIGISNPLTTLTMGPGGLNIHNPWMTMGPGGMNLHNPWTNMAIGPGGMNIRNPWSTVKMGPRGMTISNPWTTMIMGR